MGTTALSGIVFMRAGSAPHSIRGRLVALTLALLLPAVIVTSVLLWRAYTQERAAAERQLADTARALSLVVDRQIGQKVILLDALTTSQRLRRGRFAEFAEQARQANADPAAWIVVVDANGQQLVNTVAPRGAKLPRNNKPYTFVPLDRGIRLWNLVTGSLVGRPVIVLSKSLRLNDGQQIDLAVVTRATSFLRLFVDQHLPERWTGVVLDGSKHIVARSRSDDRYVGQLASHEMRARMAASATAVKPTKTLDGIAAITAWNRSPTTGWTMLVAEPRDELAAGARTSLLAGAIFGLAFLGLGLLISYRVALSIAVPVTRLSAVATALGRGELGEAAPSTLLEIQAVQDALREAGTALRHREQDLQALNNNLELRVLERTQELAEAAESLIQAQKMEAVGRLTGGIAHDFNNLLTAVIGNIDLLQRNGGDERTVRLLTSARQAAERGAKLTGQLLAFSRRQQLRAEVVDVNRAVENTVELLHSTLGGAIGITCAPAGDLWRASADPTQLDLILLNLAINARDAMPTGGSILIETANAVIGDAARANEEPGPGEYVAVTLADRGTGMPPEVLARAFDPFFTTKPLGQGTGLGLPQVLGVLKQLGGGIRIRSHVGEGTNVTIYLPRALAQLAPQLDDDVDQTANVRGMHILLIDDDPDVRGVAASILREAGCEIIEGESGGIGLARAADAEQIDFALIDFAMPGMNGAEVAVALRAQRPELPILLMSGYADLETLTAIWDGPLIPKPFTATSLPARIADAFREHRLGRLREG